jgi:hypothetical protein
VRAGSTDSAFGELANQLGETADNLSVSPALGGHLPIVSDGAV